MYQHQEPTQAQIELERFNLGLPDDPDDEPNSFPWKPRTVEDYAIPDSYYWRSRNEFLKMVVEYSQEYNSLDKGRAVAEAWVDELLPDIANLTWNEIYWGLRNHREHPEECDCNGFNRPNGCPECRVSARVDFDDIR